jgi:phosphoribosylformylglycinamidine synthase II
MSNDTEQFITVETAQQLGLLPEEFQRIKETLDRTPNSLELNIYSVIWSERCSYKNSIAWLKSLPKEGPLLLAQSNEQNSRIINLGEGLGCTLKIESHDYTSSKEPSTRIENNAFTQTIQPFAAINLLHIGDVNSDKTKPLVNNIVTNVIKNTPTIATELFFNDHNNSNTILSTLIASIEKVEETITMPLCSIGDSVYIVGSATVSNDILSENSFTIETNQLLRETSKEAIKTSAIAGIKPIGAAGIIHAAAEISAKANVGMDIWLDRIPTLKDTMQPSEILLSESPNRTLMVAKKGREKEIEAIFEKCKLSTAIIGMVTDTSSLHFYIHDELATEIPAKSLVIGGGAPIYKCEYKEPTFFSENKKFNIDNITQPDDLKAVANFLITQPNIASKQWINKQYNANEGISNQYTHPPTDAAIINIKESTKAIALTMECNSRYVNADPETGCAIAVSQAARKIVCSGAEPAATTHYMNFGNPYNPEMYWQFVSSIKGISKACLKHQTPVTSGSFNFQNQESSETPLFLAPSIGMLGILKNKNTTMTSNFKNQGDSIYMIGSSKNDIACSEYLYSYHKVKNSPAPAFNLSEEHAVQQAVKELIKTNVIQSAHSCSEGGLFICLMECAMPEGLGFDINSDDDIRMDAFLFGEAQSRIVVSVKKTDEDQFIDQMMDTHAEFEYLGDVKGKAMIIDGENFGTVGDAKSAFNNVWK